MRSLFFVTILIGLLLASCSASDRDYSRWADLPSEGWLYTDTVFLLPVDTSLTDNDSIAAGTLKIALRHGNAYRYSNVWLEMTYRTDDSRMIRDTINMRLADVYGRWLGSGFGASYQQEVTVSPTAVVDVTQPVAVRHIMRIDTLKDIEQIGIAILK